DDHLVAGLHALVDDPGVAGPVADIDRSRLRRALLVDDIDELALRAFEHGALRHGQRIRPRRALQDHAHEFAGLQAAVGVGQLGAYLARPGRRRDAHVGEVEPAGLVVDAAVVQLERNLEGAVFGQLDPPLLHFPGEARL